MATQVREKSTSRHDSFITSQLDKASQRIRYVDLGTAVGGWLAGTLAYAVCMMLLDRAFVLSVGTRQASLVFYLIVSAIYLYLAVVRPLRWRINPYFAARQLEQTIPGSRNHVINWIDLHGEKVPGVIRSALGQRAAKDLSSADVEQAISNRQAVLVGSLAGFLLGWFVVLFLILKPGPFGSLFARAFAPFGRDSAIATRTQVKIVRPEGGDTTVSIGSPITIIAEIDGRVPDPHDKDAACLLYRHRETEPYRKRFLQRDETTNHWAATIGPLDVGNGFTYKVTAGDNETPEYRIHVRPTPLIRDFVATYRYRPYVHRADRSRIARKLEDLRGTEVHILARTTRVVREGRLDFEGKDGATDLLRGEVHPDDPQALRFRLVLDRPGKYRIRFTSTEGETYIDPNPHEVIVLPDAAPEVRLTQPCKDVNLPVNGQLELVGEATDDIGIAAVTLRLQIVGGAMLKGKPYLAGKLGTKEIGTPRRLEYKDLLELPALKDEKGTSAELRPGMTIEYWLEAADGCDYPRPNVATSQRFKIVLEEAKNDDKEKQKQQEARNKQKENEQQQEQQLKNEKNERDKQRHKEEEQEREEARQRDKKQREENKDKGNTGNDGGKEKEDRGNKEQGSEDRKDQHTREKAEQLKDALNKRNQEKGNNEKDKGEGKGEGEKNPGKNKETGDKSEGGKQENKPGGAREGDQKEEKAGEKKDAGDKSGETKSGEAREGGKPDATEGKGTAKEGGKANQGGQPKPGEGKSGEQPKPRQGEGKGAGKPGETGDAGEKKSAGDIKPGDKVRQGEGKSSTEAGKPAGERPAEKKEGANASASEKKGTGKAGGNESTRPMESKPAEGKQGENEGKAGTGKAGSGTDKPGEKKPEQGRGDPRNATKGDVEKLAKEMKGMDKGARELAKRELADIRDKARDGDAREAAGKALDEARKADQPGQGKATDSKAEAGVKKPAEKEGAGGMGESKGKAGMEEGNPGEGAGKEGAGDKREGKAPPGKAKGTENGTADNPGEGLSGDRRPGDGTDSTELQPARKEQALRHRASMMQLDEFRKKVDADVLKDAKMSAEQYNQFLRDYAELARRQNTNTDEPDSPSTPGRTGTLPSLGGKTIKPSGTSKQEVRSEGRPKPPPEYRDAHKDFLNRLVTPEKK
jgi:hypothetical protein